MAAESIGIPSVSIVCEGFEGQASATARGHGFDGLALAPTIGHVDAQSADAMIENFISHTVDLVVSGLTAKPQGQEAINSQEQQDSDPGSLDVVASGSLDDINQLFLDRGWSDGLPIIPPTRERVEAYVAVSGHDPWRTLGTAASSGRDITVWSVAVNAVMAGCRPEHLPVLLATAEILADPDYGAEHSGNTTGADALIIVSGPNTEAVGFNVGQGAMREGAHANTSVGRWLRLYLRNVFGFTADEHDKATFGNSTRVVLAEDHQTLIDIGWEPLSASAGFGVNTDTVTMARFNSGAIIGSVYGSTPEEILPYLGNGLARVTGWDLTHLYGLGHDQYQPLLILSPILARTFAKAGWSKTDVQAGLFEHARIPAATFEALIGQWSNLTAGRRRLTELVAGGLLPEVFAQTDDPQRLVPIVTEPKRIMVAVAGDPNRTNAYALANDGPHGWWTTKSTDYSYSTDLQCRINGTKNTAE